MKLRTSFFNPTAFKKDATRFAPVWALYTLFLLLMMTAVLSEKGDYWRASNIAALLGTTAVLEMGYATDLHREALIATAVVLFVFILIINLLFSLVKKDKKDKKRRKAK